MNEGTEAELDEKYAFSVRIGHETGFDSGSTLDTVYRNEPRGRLCILGGVSGNGDDYGGERSGDGDVFGTAERGGRGSCVL